MLVRKQALSELRPLIATIAGLYHMGKITITIKRGDFNPKPRTFLHRGKVQTAPTWLLAPVEISDKYRQLLKRGGRCCVCLHKNSSTARLTGIRSTPIWYSRIRSLPLFMKKIKILKAKLELARSVRNQYSTENVQHSTIFCSLKANVQARSSLNGV